MEVSRGNKAARCRSRDRGGSARVLTIFTPGGFDEYLAAFDTRTVGVNTASTVVSLEELVALAARYGCAITGPALVCGPAH